MYSTGKMGTKIYFRDGEEVEDTTHFSDKNSDITELGQNFKKETDTENVCWVFLSF